MISMHSEMQNNTVGYVCYCRHFFDRNGYLDMLWLLL